MRVDISKTDEAYKKLVSEYCGSTYTVSMLAKLYSETSTYFGVVDSSQFGSKLLQSERLLSDDCFFTTVEYPESYDDSYDDDNHDYSADEQTLKDNGFTLVLSGLNPNSSNNLNIWYRKGNKSLPPETYTVRGNPMDCCGVSVANSLLSSYPYLCVFLKKGANKPVGLNILDDVIMETDEFYLVKNNNVSYDIIGSRLRDLGCVEKSLGYAEKIIGKGVTTELAALDRKEDSNARTYVDVVKLVEYGETHLAVVSITYPRETNYKLQMCNPIYVDGSLKAIYSYNGNAYFRGKHFA